MKLFVDPKVLNSDLSTFHLSKYLITELREFYTIKEREKFYKSKQDRKPLAKCACKKYWPVCYLSIENSKLHPERPYYLFKNEFILSNIKLDHFANGNSKKKQQLSVDQNPEDLLVDRQRHTCACGAEEYDQMKAVIREKLSKDFANFNSPMWAKNRSAIAPVPTEDIHRATYEKFVKKTRLMSEEKSDYSGLTPTHSSTDNLPDTRNLPINVSVPI